MLYRCHIPTIETLSAACLPVAWSKHHAVVEILNSNFSPREEIATDADQHQTIKWDHLKVTLPLRRKYADKRRCRASNRRRIDEHPDDEHHKSTARLK